MCSARLAATLAALALAAPAGAAPWSVDGRLNRRAERPATQAGKPGSTSSISRTVVLPAGSNSVTFSYEVDSEPNDKLRFYVNAVPQWTMSGLNKRGRLTLAICGSGNCTLRFEYAKDAAKSGGRDTAWVDDIVVRSAASGIIETQRFDVLSNSVPTGWTPGGTEGGFRVASPPPERSATRPRAHSFLGNSGGSTTSYMQRSISFPFATGNQLHVSWFVDSEKDKDVFNIRVDGAVVFTRSGPNQAGHASIPIAQGNRLIRFEYVKNGSADSGLDTARIDEVVAWSGGYIVEAHGFAGRTVGVPPKTPNETVSDWTGGGTGGGWVVSEVLPPRSYAPKQVAGQANAAGWAVFAEPAVDGQVKSDYKNVTLARVVNFGSAGTDRTQVQMVASDTSKALYLGVTLAGSNVVLGSEAGQLTLFVDAGRVATLQDRGGCPANPRYPDANDRRIELAWKSAGGASAAILGAIKQEKGDCAGGWVALDGADALFAVTAAVSEPASAPGTVHAEVRLDLSASDAFAEGQLGLGLVASTTAGTASTVRLPFRDDGAGPRSGNVLTWQTVALSHTPGQPLLSEVLMDAACCYPKPSPLGGDQ